MLRGDGRRSKGTLTFQNRPSLPVPKRNFSARCSVPTAPSASVSPLSNMPSCPKTPAPMLPMR